MQPFYDDLRQDVETMVRSRSVDDSSTMTVSPAKSIRKEWGELILLAMKMMDLSVADLTGDEAMDDATGDEAMDDATGDAAGNATVNAGGVLEKILDHTITTFGSSARDVYTAIFSPNSYLERIKTSLEALDYHSLHGIIARIEQSEAGSSVSHTIFSLEVTEFPRRAHLHFSRGFEVVFKSHTIKSMALKQLELLQHSKIALMIKEMRSLSPSSSYAGFLYEGFATKQLASGELLPDLVSMRAEKGKTKFTVPTTPNTTLTPSPFNRCRERSYVKLNGPNAFDVPPENSLADYFWIPLSPNNPLFDAFIIEFKDTGRMRYAIVWILQVTLNKKHRGSADGYMLINLIKTKVEEAVNTMSQTENWARERQRVNNVVLKYVLVNTEPGTWTLPERNWRSYKGDVYYQRIEIGM